MPEYKLANGATLVRGPLLAALGDDTSDFLTSPQPSRDPPHTHTHSFLCHLYAHLHVSMRTCVCRSVGGQEATRSSGAKHMVHHGPGAYRVSCWVIHEPKGFDSLSSGHWDYMHVPFCSASLHEIPDPTQVFMLSGKQCIG